MALYIVVILDSNYKLEKQLSHQKSFIAGIASNHDHDSDSHRYKSYCYVCDAEQLNKTYNK